MLNFVCLTNVFQAVPSQMTRLFPFLKSVCLVLAANCFRKTAVHFCKIQL